ncbi:NYN domain-containing protein [Daedaleopsis nitida]|nr:NYN domain-containing protein [Daedaleopsis nitida]
MEERTYIPHRGRRMLVIKMSASVAVFWDYENCALPALEPSYTIVNRIRRLAHQFGSVKSFKAYLEYPEQSSLKSLALRSELQSCGVSLIDCPHNGRKEVADKMMMIDMMAFAIDTPAPATIILISGDRDFVYAVSVLALRQYQVVVLAPRAAHSSLKAQASAVYHWPDQFLPDLPPSSTPATLPATSTRARRSSNGNIAVVDWKSQCPTPPLTTSSDPSWDGNSSEGGIEHEYTASRPRDHDNVADMPDNGVKGSESKSADRLLCKSVSDVDSDSVVPDTDKGSPVGRSDASIGAHCQFEGLSPSNPSAIPSMSWASIAHLHRSEQRHAPTPRHLSTVAEGTGPANCRPFPPQFSGPRLNAAAPPFVLNPALPAQPADGPLDDAAAQPHPVNANANASDPTGSGGEDWQTYTRAAKKRAPGAAPLPAEFRPLVRVLKRQLAEGVVHVESSQLGQFLSQEVPRLSAIYERAGVGRLKEYTALAAEQGVVTLSRDGADGHNYVTLHPAHRRKAATLV